MSVCTWEIEYDQATWTGQSIVLSRDDSNVHECWSCQIVARRSISTKVSCEYNVTKCLFVSSPSKNKSKFG